MRGEHESPLPAGRYFVALTVPPEVTDAIAAAVEPLHRHTAADLAWTSQENWHLTLCFCGECDGETVAALEAELDRELPGRPAPEPATEPRLGQFGRRVLWVGVSGGDPLTDLAGAVRRAASRAGAAADDRPFHPHLTLARARRGSRVPDVTGVAVPTHRWVASAVVLRRSHRGAGGAVHHTVRRWALDTETAG